MIIKPKCRGFICTTVHPIGCAKNVEEQINYVKAQGPIDGPKRVLVIGSSTGFGLSSRIVSAFGLGADTIGVFFEKPATQTRFGTAGWYNNQAFEQAARKEGLVAESLNGDAFSSEIKQETIERIQKHMPMGKVDAVIYSLAAPKRVHPVTKQVYSSVIKPIGQAYENKTVDFHTGVVSQVAIQPASEQEISDTIAVMGGEDWKLWMEALLEADVLADHAVTIAYSYIGPSLTHPIYKDGTIGQAKLDLEKRATEINERLASKQGKAYVSVNKALVTQASSAIPVVPLYISILYKVMKEAGTHEGCVEQIYRLYKDRLFLENGVPTDEQGRIRIDDLEMEPGIQQKVSDIWAAIESSNINELSDLIGYRHEFLKLFGFSREDVDYEQEVDSYE